MTHRQLRTDSVNNTSEILGQCLRAIEAGEATVEGCIARYPNNPELAQLLHAMTTVQELPRPVMPMSDKVAMRQQVMAKYRAQQAAVKPVHHSVPRRMPRWAQFALAFSLLVILFMSGGAGLVRASASTVPGDSLYGIKRLAEQVELSISDAHDRPTLLYQMAQTRLNELNTLSDQHRPWNNDEITDLTTSLRIAIAVQPDKARPLIDSASFVLQKAETAGTLATGKRDEVLQALSACPPSEVNATPCAVPLAKPNMTPTTALTDVPTEKPRPSSTPTVGPTNTLVPSATPTLTPTPSSTPTETLTPSSTPVTGTPTPTLSNKAFSAKATNTPALKPSKTSKPTDDPALHPTYTWGPKLKTSPTPGTGNNNSNANGGNSTDNGKGGGNSGNANGNANGNTGNAGGNSGNSGGGGGDNNGNGGNGNGGGGGGGSANASSGGGGGNANGSDNGNGNGKK